MKKKKKKNNKERAKRWLIASIVFLVIVLISGISILLNSKDFYVESRTKVLTKRQKNDTDDKKTVGWLRVQGTNIDFPIYYAPGYDFMYESEDFAWTEVEFKDLNNIVYLSGHNIKNNARKPLIVDKDHSRFEQLLSFTYYDFAKNNQFIQYTFDGKDNVYQIFAVTYANASDVDTYNTEKYSKKEMKVLVNDLTEESLYKYNLDVNENDKIIVLSTCTGVFGDDQDISFLVGARLLREGERARFVKMKKTEEYKRVEKQMKGGDSDDEA